MSDTAEQRAVKLRFSRLSSALHNCRVQTFDFDEAIQELTEIRDAWKESQRGGENATVA